MAPPTPSRSFITLRWRGEAPVRRVLWRDMLGAGTLLNLFTTLAALVLMARDASTATVALVHFSPLPINLLLFAAVQRCQDRGRVHLLLAGVWLVAVTVA
ncbi:hypothetical protein [Aquincola tertiaricarbonis]|uniref:hypothetical protein n=1 Tax=Aquincola tertiaricarbonis TaxID=391953 RepID=UPI000614F65A|nr:hypothetical protein [Aquincola tertiaricarbonis]